jgi:CMP/dCMP kinase
MAQFRKVITVDGLAGSGKTTLARELANRLGFIHLNSGLLYRGLGWLAIENRLPVFADQEACLRLIEKHTLALVLDENGKNRLQIDGKLLGDVLTETIISDRASQIAQHELVRKGILEIQQNAFPGSNLIAEGRDMGTVVFPDAALKFFVIADAEVRATRRLDQLIINGQIPTGQNLDLSKAQLAIEISERDRRDQERVASPTIAAPGSIIIDNSFTTLSDVIDKMLTVAAEHKLVIKPTREIAL